MTFRKNISISALNNLWQNAKPSHKVLLVLTICLFVALVLPQSWTRSWAQAMNGFAFTQLNHALLLHITEMGDAVFCGSIGLLVVAYRPDLFKRVLFVIIVATLLSNLLKGYFNYPRPPAIFGTETVIGPAHKTRSFPSGHTLTAFVVAGFLWQVFRHQGIRAITLGLAIAVGLSRVLLGVHWLTDVFFGAWLGWGAVMMLRVLFPTKFDIDTVPSWLLKWQKNKRFNGFYRWLSKPFSARGNQLVILLCGTLILMTILQKPAVEVSVEWQRQLIGLAWIGVIATQIYYFFDDVRSGRK